MTHELAPQAWGSRSIGDVFADPHPIYDAYMARFNRKKEQLPASIQDSKGMRWLTLGAKLKGALTEFVVGAFDAGPDFFLSPIHAFAPEMRHANFKKVMTMLSMPDLVGEVTLENGEKKPVELMFSSGGQARMNEQVMLNTKQAITPGKLLTAFDLPVGEAAKGHENTNWYMRSMGWIREHLDQFEKNHSDSLYADSMRRFRNITEKLPESTRLSPGMAYLEWDARKRGIAKEIDNRLADLAWNVLTIVPWGHENARSPFYATQQTEAKMPDLVGKDVNLQLTTGGITSLAS